MRHCVEQPETLLPGCKLGAVSAGWPLMLSKPVDGTRPKGCTGEDRRIEREWGPTTSHPGRSSAIVDVAGWPKRKFRVRS
jgi:hypothetical protein